MVIKYKDKKLKKQIEDASWINKEFSKGVYEKTQDCLKILTAAENIGQIWELRPPLQIKKKKGTKNIGKFRVNKSVRIEFSYSNEKDFLQVENIEVVDIHNHKYLKRKD